MTDPNAPIWCPCGEYRAIPHLKHCPVCLDEVERRRARKDNK